MNKEQIKILSDKLDEFEKDFIKRITEMDMIFNRYIAEINVALHGEDIDVGDEDRINIKKI